MAESVQTLLANGVQQLRNGNGWHARIARGTIWLGTGSATENGLRFVRGMILARLLAPQAFGLVALVTLVTGAADAFTQIGVKEAVIQSPHGCDKTYLNAAWWLSFLRGIALYAVALVLSPLLASFYGQPSMVPMLSVALLATVFTGSISTRAYASLREMNYAKWVTINNGGATCGIIVTVVLALFIPSPWALVIGITTESAARCLLSFIVCPFLPRLDFDRTTLHALLRYARGVFGLGVLAFLYYKTDIFVLGKVSTPEQLGIYTLAYGLVYFPNLFCDAVVSPILMSTFSSLQNDRSQLASALLRSSQVLSTLFFPLFTLMACTAPWLLRVVYGPAYSAASHAFAILCASSAIRIIGGSLVTLYFATGRPELNRQASFVRMVVMLALVVPLIHRYGIVGAATACLVSGIIWQIYNVLRLRSVIGLSTFKYAMSLSAGVAVSGSAFALWVLLT